MGGRISGGGVGVLNAHMSKLITASSAKFVNSPGPVGGWGSCNLQDPTQA